MSATRPSPPASAKPNNKKTGVTQEQSDAYDVLPCDKVITIPQYVGTCWFNALLMTMFYSEATRDVILNAMKKNRWAYMQASPRKSLQTLYKIFSHMLRMYKRPSDVAAYKWYDRITPELILYYLHRYDPKRFALQVQRLPNKTLYAEKFGHAPAKYFRNLFGLLRVPAVHLDARPLDWKRRFDSFRLCIHDKHNPPGRFLTLPEVKRLLVSRPEVLLVTVPKRTKESMRKLPAFHYLKGTYAKMPPAIRFGDRTYVVDSVTFTNLNQGQIVQTPAGKTKTMAGHAIAGVTCNRRRFIYSGWMKRTKDKARTEDEEGGIAAVDRPCPIMPFDWVSDRRNFSITAKQCQVQLNLPPHLHKFNSHRGYRTLVYVRSDFVHYKKHALERAKQERLQGHRAKAAAMTLGVMGQAVFNFFRPRPKIVAQTAAAKPKKKK